MLGSKIIHPDHSRPIRQLQDITGLPGLGGGAALDPVSVLIVDLRYFSGLIQTAGIIQHGILPEHRKHPGLLPAAPLFKCIRIAAAHAILGYILLQFVFGLSIAHSLGTCIIDHPVDLRIGHRQCTPVHHHGHSQRRCQCGQQFRTQ